MGKIKEKIKKELDRDLRRVKVEVYHDVKYVKTHIPKVIASFIALAFFIILFVLFKTKEGDKFTQTSKEKLAIANAKNYVIKPDKVKSLLADKNYKFVDIRSNQERKVFKIDDVKHIPFKKILEEKYKPFWNNKENKILICKNEIESTQAGLILYELGYKNILVLEGGMDYWREFDNSEFSLAKNKSINNEKPKYDYAKIMKSFKAKSKDSIKENKKKEVKKEETNKKV